jgi:hypothetical protein
VDHEIPSGEDWDEEIRKEEREDWDAEVKKEERPPGYLLFTGNQGQYVFGKHLHDFPKTEKKKKKKKGKRGSQKPEDPILEEAVRLFEGRGLRTEEFYF